MTREEKIEYLAKAVMTLSELGDGKTAYALNEIRLEMKSQLELPEGLEEAADQFVGYDMDTDDLRDYELGIEAFKAGAEWMKEQMGKQAREQLAKDEITLADLVAFDEGLSLGRRLERQEMTKKAFRCEIIKSRTHMPHLKPYFFSSDYGKIGDKVKVIVIPEE